MSASVLDEAPVIAAKSAAAPADPVLTAENLSVGYEKTVILDEVSITIPRGSVTAILGSTGGGKTTLLQTLGLLAQPLSGALTYVRAPGDKPLSLARLRLARRNRLIRSDFAYVFQRVELVNHWDARSNIALPLISRGLPPPEIEETVRALCERMCLRKDIGGRPVAQLSGGERQRIGIARALAADPTVIFADEPFGSLDRTTATEVMGHFFRELAERSITGVMVSHDEDAVRTHCQQEYRINGKYIEPTR